MTEYSTNLMTLFNDYYYYFSVTLNAQAKLKANPPGGIPPGLTFCSRGCNVYRELGSAHCNACNVCYVDVDHHCPWTGKCVAKDNIFWFYAFLVAGAF